MEYYIMYDRWFTRAVGNKILLVLSLACIVATRNSYGESQNSVPSIPYSAANENRRLSRKLSSGTMKEVYDALTELTTVRVDNVADELLHLVHRHEYGVSAIHAFAFQGGRDAIPALFMLSTDASLEEQLRTLSIVKIGQIGGVTESPALLSIAHDKDEPTCRRLGAIQGLGEIYKSTVDITNDNPHVCDVAEELYGIANSDKESLVLRVAAAQALCNIRYLPLSGSLCATFQSHKSDRLGFWAAVAFVITTDGDISGVDMFYAIYNRDPRGDDSSVDIGGREAAMSKITNNRWTLAKILLWPFLLVTFCVFAVVAVRSRLFTKRFTSQPGGK